MSFRKWLSDFRALHGKAKDNKLSAHEREAYESAREELAVALLAAQQLTLKPGETARQALRVARSLQLDLELPSGPLRTPTVDISLGGFAAFLPRDGVTRAASMRYSLRLPAGDPVTGHATVTQITQQSGHVRVSFAFEKMNDENRDRLEFVIIDAALAAIEAGRGSQ